MKAFLRPLILALVLFVGISNSEAKSRPIVSLEGKISKMEHGKDKRHKHYWQYEVKTSSGKVVLVRDYKYGKYRKPASVGLRDGGKTKAKGFFVKIRTQRDSDAKSSVLIVQ